MRAHIASYTATVAGGLLGFLGVGFPVVLVAGCYGGNCDLEWVHFLLFAAVGAAAGFVAGAFLALLRAGAVLETSIAVAVLSGADFGCVYYAELNGAFSGLPSWLTWVFVLAAPAALLIAARWFGVRWHTRRGTTVDVD